MWFFFLRSNNFDELAHRNGCYVEWNPLWQMWRFFFLRSNHFDEQAHRNGCYVKKKKSWHLPRWISEFRIYSRFTNLMNFMKSTIFWKRKINTRMAKIWLILCKNIYKIHYFTKEENLILDTICSSRDFMEKWEFISLVKVIFELHLMSLT